MKTHADKTQENKNQEVAKEVPKQTDGEFTFEFEDKRPEAVAQRKILEMEDNRPEARQLRASMEMEDNRPEAKQLRAFMEMEDNRPEARQLRASQEMIDNSPRMERQGQQIERMFGEPVQKKEALPEEELQMKAEAAPIQRKGPEEEELLQGKFDPVQKKGPEEEELLQGKFEPVQKKGPEEEELLQGKFETIQKKGLEEDELQMKEAPIQKKKNKTGLLDKLKSGIEKLSGLSMDDVKVHRNSDKPAQLNAHAYTQGTDIHVAPGQEKHLPHEAWHVVQQKQGRVKPTTQMHGKVNVNDDVGLEKEADVMGAKALQIRGGTKTK